MQPAPLDVAPYQAAACVVRHLRSCSEQPLRAKPAPLWLCFGSTTPQGASRIVVAPMPDSDGELRPDEREALAHSRVWIRNAGGLHSRQVLVAYYYPRRGQKKKVQSNHKKYGKSWVTAGEITKADKLAFLAWIENGLSNKGVGGNGNARTQPSSIASPRSSARIANNIRPVCIGAHSVVHIEEAVVQCVKYLVHTVARQARCIVDRPMQHRVNHVAGKRRSKTSIASTLLHVHQHVHVHC